MKMEKDYILENGNIIDVESGLTHQASIEIKNNRIQRIIPKHKGVGPTTDKQRIDLNGKWVIPGLLDMHCHIQEGYAPQFVASGVTTVRNTAGNVLQLEKLINAPFDAPTPRVYSADRMIDGLPGLWGPTSFANFVTDSQKEAKEEVKRQVAAGAKFIKAYGWLSLEVMEAVVLEARKYGLEVSCDLIHSKEVNALDAAKIGVTWFEHASGFIQALYPDWSMQADQEIWKSIDWIVPDEKRIKDLCEKMLTYDVKLCPTMIINDQIEMMLHYWYPKNDVTKTLEIEGGLVEHWKTLSGQVESLQPIGLQNLRTRKPTPLGVG